MYGQATKTKYSDRTNSPGVSRHEQARTIEVFMAGDIEHAKQVVRRWCKESPCCVTVTPTTFIYRGGEEAGFVVGFRNYPRFPSDAYTLRAMATELADRLREELGQDSYMSVDHGGMATWSTTRQVA
jgi:hypothetical protein